MVCFLAPYPLSANRLWRRVGTRLILSSEGRAWKRQVGMNALESGAKTATSPMSVGIVLHPRITKTGKPSKIRLDLDNSIKPTLDALNGLAWVDDSQVVEIHAVVGPAMVEGGMTITVEPAYAGHYPFPVGD